MPIDPSIQPADVGTFSYRRGYDVNVVVILADRGAVAGRVYRAMLREHPDDADKIDFEVSAVNGTGEVIDNITVDANDIIVTLHLDALVTTTGEIVCTSDNMGFDLDEAIGAAAPVPLITGRIVAEQGYIR